MVHKKILIIGGTGYIGRKIVSLLCKEKYPLEILSRKKSEETVECDIQDINSLCKLSWDYDCVIYLAAVIRSVHKRKYKENMKGLQNVITCMHQHSIKKIVYYSTQNVSTKKTGWYGKSKRDCEEYIKKNELDYMIIRPNYVYGIDTHNYFYQLLKIMKKTSFCPIIGNGNYKIQPVRKEDLAKITVSLIKHWQSQSIIEVSGKTTLSLNNICDLCQSVMQKRVSPVHIPLGFLQIFKYIIPFDIEGFTEDRIARSDNICYGTADIKEDLNSLSHLV